MVLVVCVGYWVLCLVGRFGVDEDDVCVGVFFVVVGLYVEVV